MQEYLSNIYQGSGLQLRNPSVELGQETVPYERYKVGIPDPKAAFQFCTVKDSGSVQGNIVLGCIPALSPEFVGRGEHNTQEEAVTLCKDTLQSILTVISGAWPTQDMSKTTTMVCLEAHEGEGWHYHWAIGGLEKVSMSKAKFVEICTALR